MDYKKEYERWRSCATDADLKAELENMDGCHSAPKQTKRSAIRTKALHIKKSRTV